MSGVTSLSVKGATSQSVTYKRGPKSLCYVKSGRVRHTNSAGENLMPASAGLAIQATQPRRDAGHLRVFPQRFHERSMKLVRPA